MSDIFDKVTADQDFIRKFLAKIPGFNGYIERSNRRASDKLLREHIAEKFQTLEQKVSALQRELISMGGLEWVDDLEAAAVVLRQFTDRVRRATYGYSSLFEAVKINEEELSRLYEFDLALLDLEDEVDRAIDNVEGSLGTDGLPAAIRHLRNLAKQCVETFNQRSAVVIVEGDTQE